MKKKMVAKVEMAYCTPLLIGIFYILQLVGFPDFFHEQSCIRSSDLEVEGNQGMPPGKGNYEQKDPHFGSG